MIRAVRDLVGGALIIAAGLIACWALYNLIRIGTCASGGPYVSARPCPPGTELKILAIFGAVIAGLAGAGIATFSGRGMLAWACGFIGLGVGIGVGALGPARPPEEGAGLTILGISIGGMMLAFALPGIFGILSGKTLAGTAAKATLGAASKAGKIPDDAQRDLVESLKKLAAAQAEARGTATEAAEGKAAAAAGTGIATELESLAALRDSGTLSEAEFEAAKKRVLDKL